jgi:hypothetical protein
MIVHCVQIYKLNKISRNFKLPEHEIVLESSIPRNNIFLWNLLLYTHQYYLSEFML